MKRLKFYSKSHKYKYGKDEFTSVTTFLNKFYEKFDETKVAREQASKYWNKKAKKGVRYWKNLWKKNREDGTLIHKQIEDFITGVNPFTDKLHPKALYGIEYFKSKINNVSLVKSEMIIYNKEHKLAGTVDLMIENGNKVCLYDWKTRDKKLTDIGYDGKKCFEPIEYLDDCHITKYTLQLSLYAYMLELNFDAHIDKLYIVQLTDKGVKEIEVEYMKDVIKKLLKYDREVNKNE